MTVFQNQVSGKSKSEKDRQGLHGSRTLNLMTYLGEAFRVAQLESRMNTTNFFLF